MIDVVIIGAGLTGCVLAERLATVQNQKVLLIDRRRHIGGNCYDYYDEHGVLVHKYGPHIFHTNEKYIFDYLSSFTDWHYYQHKVLSVVDGKKVPLPINMDTLNELFGLRLSSEAEVKDFYDSNKIAIAKPQNAEEQVLASLGVVLYEKFFKGYTKKQWGVDATELETSVTARIPVRTNRDDRYFTDSYQGLPRYGYTKMFEKMVNHPNVKLMLGCEWNEVKNYIPYKKFIYTGSLDEYYDFKFGKLSYRNVCFEYRYWEKEFYQDVAQENYPNDYDYTRITEYKRMTGQVHPGTTVAFEYPREARTIEDRYYPIPGGENNDLYQQYAFLAKSEELYYCGRLAEYKYYNMDQIVLRALQVFERMSLS